ncbi:hypothetical protein K445DRAFT_318777 [Daldinia sp. EC12]|nr:hypothetical protein K445DRAFT_318777 [Daldinia sp. EC12]
MTSATASSFLQRIPVEVRRMILIEAFGNRTLHLDLRLIPPDNDAQKQRIDSGIDPGEVGYLQRNTSHPKPWRLFGRVCQHDIEPCAHGIGSFPKPYTDVCLGATASSSHARLRTPPYQCFLGVMGWLLTCRQAYTEGIEVLYSTNDFHIPNGNIIHVLPSLIRAENRAMITSVEMVWQLNLQTNSTSGWDHLTGLARAVQSIFPGLRKLHIYLRGSWKLPSIDPEDSTKEQGQGIGVLEIMDEMIRNFGLQLQECIITVPASVFWSQQEYSTSEGKKNMLVTGQVSDRIWRPLRPLPNSEDKEDAGSGYWIREGPDHIPYPFAYIIDG